MSSESSTGRLGALRERGFTLVALMIILIVLNVAVATAMQLWTKVAQREQEEELIFRGLQYAEAIRVYQQRYNRAPTSLKELMDARPRVLRKMWKDPLSESGEWNLILAGTGSDVTQVAGGNAPVQSSAPGFDESGWQPTGDPVVSGPPPRGQQVGGQGFGSQQTGGQEVGSRRNSRQRDGGFGESRRSRRNRRPVEQPGFGSSDTTAEDDGFGTADELSRAFDEGFGSSSQGSGSSFGSDGQQTQLGPLEGVRPTASGQAAKHFLGLDEYGAWEFRAQMLAQPRVSPEGLPLMPRLDPSALGRPFPSWLSLGEGGSLPGGPVEGDTPSSFLPDS